MRWLALLAVLLALPASARHPPYTGIIGTSVQGGSPPAIDSTTMPAGNGTHSVTISPPANSWVLAFEYNQGAGNVTGVTVNGASATFVTAATDAGVPATTCSGGWGICLFSYWNVNSQSNIVVTTTGSTTHDGRLATLVITGSSSGGTGTTGTFDRHLTGTEWSASASVSASANSLLVWATAGTTAAGGSAKANNTLLASYYVTDSGELGRYNGGVGSGSYTVGTTTVTGGGFQLAYMISQEVKAP